MKENNKWKNNEDKNSLEDRIAWMRDGLNEGKNNNGGKRFYLIIKDENGKTVECLPITSKIDRYGNENFPKVITFPYLPKKSIVLTDKQYKEMIDRKTVVINLQSYKLKNKEEIYLSIEERNK